MQYQRSSFTAYVGSPRRVIGELVVRGLEASAIQVHTVEEVVLGERCLWLYCRPEDEPIASAFLGGVVSAFIDLQGAN